MSNMTKPATDTRKCQASNPAEAAYCSDVAVWQIDMGPKVRTYSCDNHVIAQIRHYTEYAASYGVTKATVRPL